MGIEIIYGTLTFLSALSAIFIFISILIFGLTISKTKRFMETNVPAVYRSAKAYRNASIVFLVLVCIYVVSNMSDLITSVVRLTEDGTADEGIFYILYCVEFTAAVIGAVTGICAVAGFGKAKILYDRLYRPARLFILQDRRSLFPIPLHILSRTFTVSAPLNRFRTRSLLSLIMLSKRPLLRRILTRIPSKRLSDLFPP